MRHGISTLAGSIGLSLLLTFSGSIIPCPAGFEWNCAPVFGANLTPDQRKTIDKVLDFYKRMGDTDDAKKLKEGVENGSIKFGPVPDNDNAATDISSSKTSINPGIVQAVNGTSLESWRATSDLAATISHELIHKEQESWAWRRSTISEWMGFGNGCEQKAWGNTFEKMAAWIRNTKTEVDSKASAREKAEAAMRLKMLCQEFTVLRNDYLKLKGTIGPLSLTAPGGSSTNLDELFKEVTGNEKISKEIIGNAGVMVVPFDGNYTGVVSGKGRGNISFKIQGFSIAGRFNGSYEGDPVSGSVSGQSSADGKISLTINGSLVSGKENYPFAGRLTGRLLNGHISGEWFASNKWGSPSGTWVANKLALNK